MSVFRRRRDRDAGADAASVDDELGPDELDELGSEDVETDDADESSEPAVAGTFREGGAGRAGGPWDVSEVDEPGDGRIDLGGMWLPGREGLEVRVEADQTTGNVVAVTVVTEEGALQLQPFAAPRTEGIWDEVRAEIRSGITRQGGTADESDGPFGTELRTKVPVRKADGSSAVQPARFLGVDGPRWFLRGVLSGPPALDEAAAEPLLAVFRDVVVVRGSEAMAPRDPIPLSLPSAEPQEPDDAEEENDGDQLKPFERGPEITEIH